jgi:glycosyltransferase involved in cell wall biosynthesis
VRRLARWLLEGSPQVLSLSERWAEKLRPLFPRARIDVLVNPVEVARFADLAEERFRDHARGGSGAPPIALFLGDLLERKGVYDLVAAWPSVARAVPGARLVLAGSGEIERVRAAAVAAGVADRVEMPGWIDFDEKRQRLRAATVFVLPSYTEGVPISLLEAMAAGLPSVVTPVGGVLDAVSDGQEALVVAPGDREALARALVQVLESPDLARALGGTARLRVDSFDIAAYSDRLDRIYRSILGMPALAVRVATAAPTAGGTGAPRHEAAR